MIQGNWVEKSTWANISEILAVAHVNWCMPKWVFQKYLLPPNNGSYWIIIFWKIASKHRGPENIKKSRWKNSWNQINSRSWTEAIHSGNRKIQNLLKCPIFNGEHHDMIEIWKSQLIAEILSILYFNKNFMTDLSSKIVQQRSMTQHIRNYLWIRLNP